MYCQTSYNYSYDLRTSNLNPLCGLDRLLQVILILFVVLIGYYGFLIFMDIQHLKAAEAAAQENQSEEEIDITDEARSFQPQQVTRDDKKKEEEKKREEAGNENDSNTDKQQTTSGEQPNENASSKSDEEVPNSEASTATEQTNSSQHLMSNRMRMLLLKVMKKFPIRKHQQLPSKQMLLLQLRILHPKQNHRLNLLSLIIKKKYLLPKLLIKMKLKTLPMRMPKQPHRKLDLLPDPTAHRATGTLSGQPASWCMTSSKPSTSWQKPVNVTWVPLSITAKACDMPGKCTRNLTELPGPYPDSRHPGV